MLRLTVPLFATSLVPRPPPSFSSLAVRREPGNEAISQLGDSLVPRRFLWALPLVSRSQATRDYSAPTIKRLGARLGG